MVSRLRSASVLVVLSLVMLGAGLLGPAALQAEPDKPKKTAADLVCDGCVDSTDVEDGSLAPGDLAFDPALQLELDDFILALSTPGTINEASNPVDWTNLKNVPAGFADGVDGSGGTATDLDCGGCVDATDLGDGSVAGGVGGSVLDNTITADDLAFDAVGWDELADDAVDASAIQDGAVTGEATPVAGGPVGKIALGTITGANIAGDSITAAQLAPGSVDTDAILDGAVTPQKQFANAAVGSVAGPIVVTDGTGGATVASTPITVAGSADHAVLVQATAQITLSCPVFCLGDELALAQWQIAADTTPQSPSYFDQVTVDDSTLVASVSHLVVNLSPGLHSLEFLVGAFNEDVEVSNASLIVVDLGVAS